MEFRYAIDCGIPILSFPHSNPGQIPVEKSCKDDAERKKLTEFMKIVNQRQYKAWSNKEELVANVYQIITRLKKDYPAVGWIKGDRPASEELLIENRQLHKENNDLKKKLSTIEAEWNIDLSQGDDPLTIEFFVTYYHSAVDDNKEKRICFWQTTWDELFCYCFPRYENRLKSHSIRYNIEDTIRTQCHDEIDSHLNEMIKVGGCVEKYSIEESKMRFGIVRLHESMIDMIIFQFASLGYIEEQLFNNEKGTDIYWALTGSGRRKLIKKYAFYKD